MRYNEIITEAVLNTVNPPSKRAGKTAEFNQAYADLDLEKTGIKLGAYGIYLYHPADTDQEKLEVLLKNEQTSDIVGVLRLIKLPHRGGEFVFTDVNFDPQVQGGNYALKLYAYVIKRLGYTVASDDIQSKGGQSIWKKLANYPGILVYQWNPETDEYSAWDPADSDSAYLDLDDAESAERELEQIRDKLDALLDAGKIDYDEYGMMLKRHTADINAEIEKMDQASDIRLVATRQKGLK